MIEDISSLKTTGDHSTRETITQTMQAYMQRHPENTTFCVLLPIAQDTGIVKQAVASASLATGKRIDLISLVEIHREEEPAGFQLVKEGNDDDDEKEAQRSCYSTSVHVDQRGGCR